MQEHTDLTKLLLGRLSWESIPYHEPILLATFIMVAIGGAAQFYARCIERTDDVSLMEFGTPEAMWHLEVKDFPAIVTMDAHGNSLHKSVEDESAAVLASLKK